MALLLKNVNINFMDEIGLFGTLYWVEKFKLYNKHQTFLARHLGFISKKFSKEDITS